MEYKMVTIPFDLETAKKINIGERGFWIHSKKMGLIWITIPTVL